MPGKNVWAISVWGGSNNKIHCSVDTESSAGDPESFSCVLVENQLESLLRNLRNEIERGGSSFRPFFWNRPGWVWVRHGRD